MEACTVHDKVSCIVRVGEGGRDGCMYVEANTEAGVMKHDKNGI